ncbi:MAG: hypothetical protein WBX00_07660 [Isosphaeraceae bacterium]
MGGYSEFRALLAILTMARTSSKAGACCLGVGGALVEPKAIATGDFTRIRELACQYAAIVTRVRETR